MTARLGIMGGMFDPVHTGHLKVAALACDELELSHVRLVPCSVPSHRGTPGASAVDRLKMLQLALATETRFLADDREIRRPGVSYMVDTLHSFRQEFPDTTLVYIMGQDSFAGLTGWHRWREILTLCHLCVVSRPGAGQIVHRDLLASQVSTRAALYEQQTGHIIQIDGAQFWHSSTQVRQLIYSDSLPEDPADIIPASVLHYIRQHKLYQTRPSS
ncbi:nicotinate-nucleotide adenylyltransferase [Pseudohongiella spirulinae]|uniref:Probable nicotinate-nucleotide adenylyltransferase n=1 Tax=Pseudohongiella spirulinae TaxID=1249552 RepID=A0A0S2KEP3_9GAMM|nr:nicotinate-nucleotide adenylyltransferase [Pseudohongiella spirulinae]ALO46812.1 nicotinate-nucleotide adenylyltransferase [Pseudohongiella spirulinae]